jgi:hypothetical protein
MAETPKKELLDKEGLKSISIKGTGEKVVVPKSVVTDDQIKKFGKTLERIAGRNALQGSKKETTVNQYLGLFNYYMNSILEKQSKDRFKRYDSMDFIIENDGALAQVKKVLKDEILQEDVFEKPITVNSKNVAFKKAIMKLFKDLGVRDLIPEAAENIIKYGDAFWLLDINSKSGITKIIPEEPRHVKRRFEFSIADLRSKKNTLKKRFTGLQAIIELGSNIESRAKDFNKVLLGFQVQDTIFPYWQVLHFRNFTTKEKIFPFGIPLFFDSQSEARMYLNSKVVVSMMRSSAFMKEYVSVKTGEEMDPNDQWELVSQVKQMVELFLSTGGRTTKDVPSFGEKIYFPEGLLSFESKEGGTNFRDRFEDLKLMRDDTFTSIGLSKGYFVGDERGTYVPVKALMQQDKKAARMVFGIQNIIISQLMKAVEVHFTHTGEFDPYEEEYTISLPYPIPDIDDSVIGMSQAKMQYAITTIDSLKQSLGLVKLPEPVVRSMITKFFPFSDEEVQTIIKQMRKDQQGEEESGIDPYGKVVGDPYGLQKVQVDQVEKEVEMADQPAAPAPPEDGQPVASKGQALAPESKMVDDKEAVLEAYLKAIEKQPIEEVVEKVIAKDLCTRDSDEFVHMGRHYINNSYVSTERNSTVLVSFKEPKFKSKLMEARTAPAEDLGDINRPGVDKANEKLKGVDVQEDVTTDRRFLKKEEK